MSRAAPPTPEELQAAFDELLAGPPEDGMPTDTGLDEQTTAAIERVWSAGANAPDSLRAGARNEFAMQLDGTHAREGQARQQLIFEQVHAEHQTQT